MTFFFLLSSRIGFLRVTGNEMVYQKNNVSGLNVALFSKFTVRKRFDVKSVHALILPFKNRFIFILENFYL